MEKKDEILKEMKKVAKAFGADLSSGQSYIDGLISRKKQVVPVLEEVFNYQYISLYKYYKQQFRIKSGKNDNCWY